MRLYFEVEAEGDAINEVAMQFTRVIQIPGVRYFLSTNCKIPVETVSEHMVESASCNGQIDAKN